jgi:hypothetical protein
MTRRKLFIHIGLHKTGTTSIQQCLTESSYQLHQAGMLYPVAGTRSQRPNTHYWRRHLTQPRRSKGRSR